MKHDPDKLDQDPVWDLLRQSPRREANPRFVDDVVRAARLSEPERPWWRTLALPLGLGGLATAATAVAVAFIMLNGSPDSATSDPAVVNHETPVSVEPLSDLDEAIRSEALLVAAEHPSYFTDAELVSLLVY